MLLIPGFCVCMLKACCLRGGIFTATGVHRDSLADESLQTFPQTKKLKECCHTPVSGNARAAGGPSAHLGAHFQKMSRQGCSNCRFVIFRG